MSKKIKYLIGIVILLGLNLVLFYSDGSAKSSSFDDELFMIKDTTQINAIVIENEDEKIEILRNDAGWKLNNQYPVDQNFLKILFSILNKVRVKRELGKMNVENSGDLTLGFADGSSRSFNFSSDPIGTKSFFIEDGIGYQVEVPGYRDNVINIFELNEDQWRSRLVFDGSWRTIQKLSLKHGGEELTIRFNSQFFDVDGQSLIDSSAVVDYLNQFQFFQAIQMISEGLDGVTSAFVDYDKKAGTMEFDDEKIKPEAIFAEISKLGYTVTVAS